MVFRGNGGRGGGQSSSKEFKEGLLKIDCRLTANGEEEGAGIQEIYNKAFWGQVNFFEARPNPFPPPTQAPTCQTCRGKFCVQSLCGYVRRSETRIVPH